MCAKKTRSILSRIITALAIAGAILLSIFLMGRYGWRLGGFRACQSAGIETVEVSETAVRITGFYPGSFPEGFIGYYGEERDGTLYVGFRFSAVFGFWDTGDFDITVPVKGQIQEVIVKTRMNETLIWSEAEGAVSQSERCGVYVRLETNAICSLSMSYAGESHGVLNAADAALESGVYLFLENDIAYASKEAEEPIPFTLTAVKSDGSVFASGTFLFDAGMEKLYLTVTADGKILDDTIPSLAENTSVPEAYAAVIGAYDTALREGWDGAALMAAGLSSLAAECGSSLEDIGYAVTDLDGDGTEELAIGSLAEDGFYEKLVFSLYTLDGSGAPLLLFNSTEFSRYYYVGGFKFANLGTNDWNESFVTTLKLEDREMIDMTYTTDPADYVQMALIPLAQWR